MKRQRKASPANRPARRALALLCALLLTAPAALASGDVATRYIGGAPDFVFLQDLQGLDATTLTLNGVPYRPTVTEDGNQIKMWSGDLAAANGLSDYVQGLIEQLDGAYKFDWTLGAVENLASRVYIAKGKVRVSPEDVVALPGTGQPLFGGELPSSEDEQPSFKVELPPPGGVAQSPSEGGQSPSEDEQPSEGVAQSSSEDEQPSEGVAQSPSEGGQPSSDDEQPSSDDELPPSSGDELPPSDDELLPPSGETGANGNPAWSKPWLDALSAGDAASGDVPQVDRVPFTKDDIQSLAAWLHYELTEGDASHYTLRDQKSGFNPFLDRLRILRDFAKGKSGMTSVETFSGFLEMLLQDLQQKTMEGHAHWSEPRPWDYLHLDNLEDGINSAKYREWVFQQGANAAATPAQAGDQITLSDGEGNTATLQIGNVWHESEEWQNHQSSYVPPTQNAIPSAPNSGGGGSSTPSGGSGGTPDSGSLAPAGGTGTATFPGIP